MKKLCTVLFTHLFIVNIIAQTEDSVWKVNPNDEFNKVNTPIAGGLELWLMRQNLTTEAYQNIFEYNYQFTNNQESEPQYLNFTSFFQVFSKEKLSSMAGLRYRKYNLLTDKIPDINYQHAWFWSTWRYIPNEKWSFHIAFEYYKAGNLKCFNQQTGDRFFYYIIPSYSFNKQLTLIPILGYEHKFKENSKPEGNIISALLLKWTPSEQYKIATGFPIILSTEWAISPKLNFAFYAWYNLQGTTFFQYKFTKKAVLQFITQTWMISTKPISPILKLI